MLQEHFIAEHQWPSSSTKIRYGWCFYANIQEGVHVISGDDEHLFLLNGYPNLGPKLLGIKAHDDINLAPQPSKGPPSLRFLGTHPARGKRPSSSGWFPPRSRLGGLEGDPHPRAGGLRLVRGLASSSLRSKLEPASPGTTPNAPRLIKNHHDAVKKQGSLLHAITCSPERTSVKSTRNNAPPPSKATSRETMERRAQVATLDVVNRHEKEGRYVSPCHVCAAWTNSALGDKHMSSSPSPTLLVNPYYKQHVTRCIAPLLDVRPRGRNQDKPPSFTLATRETSG
ncbi:hypothetical protein HU200_020847 [Digitaria exilis]|uniref:Uncharacterized protein n=1 Tax=Digitaria exilis TaxID=1010633 RepID=A0A835KG24_9POAL|nr:hypothetical protein HU200_020847 [Digitaria exilis]